MRRAFRLRHIGGKQADYKVESHKAPPSDKTPA